jgi:hypothetical protein
LRLVRRGPFYGVYDVGFAASVWTEQGGNAFGEFDPGPVRERLKTENIEALQEHTAALPQTPKPFNPPARGGFFKENPLFHTPLPRRLLLFTV